MRETAVRCQLLILSKKSIFTAIEKMGGILLCSPLARGDCGIPPILIHKTERRTIDDPISILLRPCTFIM